MNKTLCWRCNMEFCYEGEKYRDVNCPKCGVENDILNPNNKDWLPPEEDDWIPPEDDFIPPTEALTERKEEMGLKDWAKDNAKFIKIENGESYEGVYQGYKEGTNMNGDPAVIYKLDGKEFKSSSTALAEIFSEIDEGTKVKISRTGDGLQTRWSVIKS